MVETTTGTEGTTSPATGNGTGVINPPATQDTTTGGTPEKSTGAKEEKTGKELSEEQLRDTGNLVSDGIMKRNEEETAQEEQAN